jgi:hypothetical protein
MLTEMDSQILALANMIRHREQCRWKHGADALALPELQERIESKYCKVVEMLHNEKLTRDIQQAIA